jgi:hypothetical protein
MRAHASAKNAQIFSDSTVHQAAIETLAFRLEKV